MKLKPINEKQRKLIKELEDLHRRMAEAGLVVIKHPDWTNYGIVSLEGISIQSLRFGDFTEEAVKAMEAKGYEKIDVSDAEDLPEMDSFYVDEDYVILAKKEDGNESD